MQAPFLLAFDERLSKAGHALLSQSFLCQRWVNVFGWYSVRDLFWYQRCNKILRNFGPSRFSCYLATAMSNCSCPTSEKLVATPIALDGFVCWLRILCGHCHMALPGIIILLKFCLSFQEISLDCFVVVVSIATEWVGGKAKVKVDVRITNWIRCENVLRFRTHLQSRIRVFFTPRQQQSTISLLSQELVLFYERNFCRSFINDPKL